jgi:single-stranded-DNA-specific exonuclease
MDLSSLSQILLTNRGLKTEEEINEFFSPTRPQDIPSPFDSKQAIKLIKKHIAAGHKIAIYGDYDVDGICSTAILWETLYKDYANVFPHIPHRESEGYGLSTKGIDHCLTQGAQLIIAVDNGIVANTEVEYCRDKKCDIIIIDHHELGESLPKANAILHSTSTCAAGLTWFFCRDFLGGANLEHLALVSIAVICDIVPLIGTNRSFAKYGLQELNKTQRPGLKALFEEAAISEITPYQVGFMIGPRINAMGRLEHAVDSLRLLCTKDPSRAKELAMLLGETNKARQDLTKNAVAHALASVDPNVDVLIVSDSSYPQGVIGLIAAKLTEKFYKPSIVIAVGETESKASARSISGFHITDHIRTASHLLLGAGGHAMAAGFTVSTAKLDELKKFLSAVKIDPQILIRKSRVDAEIPLDFVKEELWQELQKFEPFGLGNPTPVFTTKNLSFPRSSFSFFYPTEFY